MALTRLKPAEKKQPGRPWYKMKRVQIPAGLLALYGVFEANNWRVASNREAERAQYETHTRAAYPDAFKAASGLNVAVIRSPHNNAYCCYTQYARDYPMGRMEGNIETGYSPTLNLSLAGQALNTDQRDDLVEKTYLPDIARYTSQAFCTGASLQISADVTMTARQLQNANGDAFDDGKAGPYQCVGGQWRLAPGSGAVR